MQIEETTEWEKTRDLFKKIRDTKGIFHAQMCTIKDRNARDLTSVKLFSRVFVTQTLVTQWTVASQVPSSMGFSRQEYWSGLPFPSPGDLPDPGIKPRSPALQADALPSEPPEKHGND